MLITPTEELELRTAATDAWDQTWARCSEMTPKQAFIEGHYLGLACGVLAARRLRREHRQQVVQLRSAIALLAIGFTGLLILVVAP